MCVVCYGATGRGRKNNAACSSRFFFREGKKQHNHYHNAHKRIEPTKKKTRPYVTVCMCVQTTQHHLHQPDGIFHSNFRIRLPSQPAPRSVRLTGLRARALSPVYASEMQSVRWMVFFAPGQQRIAQADVSGCDCVWYCFRISKLLLALFRFGVVALASFSARRERGGGDVHGPTVMCV